MQWNATNSHGSTVGNILHGVEELMRYEGYLTLLNKICFLVCMLMLSETCLMHDLGYTALNDLYFAVVLSHATWAKLIIHVILTYAIFL